MTKGKARKAQQKLQRRSKKRSSNNVSGGPNTARITETYDLPVTNVNQPEEYIIPGIPAGSRAAALAPNFGLYRIAKVTFTYKPLYDTYIPANNPAPLTNFVTTVPNLYWKMNRFGDAPPNFDDDYLKEQGAKAIRFDDKPVTVSYKPNVLLADTGAVAAGLNGGTGQVKITPWLSTDSQPGNNAFALSETIHYGHVLYVEADTVNTSTEVPIARVECKVIWEFKNPRGITAQASDPMKMIRKVGLSQ